MFKRVIIIATIFLISIISITSASEPKGGEKGQVLSPELFEGKAAKTYQIAKEIPEVLDHIYCYCPGNCPVKHEHKSLLSCYTDADKHASNCKICQNEAIRAYELHKEGKDITAIKKTIDDEFEDKDKK